MSHKIDTDKPDFSKAFHDQVKYGKNKGAIVEIYNAKNTSKGILFVDAKCNDRLLSRLTFKKRTDGYKLVKYRIVEKDFNPREVSLYELVEYLKKKKVKNIYL